MTSSGAGIYGNFGQANYSAGIYLKIIVLYTEMHNSIITKISIITIFCALLPHRFVA